MNVFNSKLLVVDDNGTNVKLLLQILAGAGYHNLQSTVDPTAVVDLHRANDFDLILLDLMMPIMDGFAVIEALKETRNPFLTPILVLTANQDREARLRALRAGARDFITKPFDLFEVLCRVRNLAESYYWQKQTEEQNRLLERRVQERTQELFDTRLEVIKRLGLAAEYRDNETGLHVVRMSHFSRLIAVGLGLPPDQVELIFQSASMHDLGKIGIPDAILLKPGRLTPDEFEVMKTHTVIGEHILGNHDSPLLRNAASIAISHHEKWNGGGYPHGLAGEDIPLVGRIVAIADVFDALTSLRPYKKPWSVESSIDYLKAQSGLHFQPELVDIFLDHLPEVLKIKEQFAEDTEILNVREKVGRTWAK